MLCLAPIPTRRYRRNKRYACKMKYRTSIRPEDAQMCRAIFDYGAFMLSEESKTAGAFSFVDDDIRLWKLNRKIAQNNFISRGYISQLLLSRRFGQCSSVASGILNHIFQKLVEWRLITYMWADLHNIEGVYQFNRGVMHAFWYWDFFENILLDEIKLIEKYRSSVPYIIVRDSAGDESIGTGFYVSSSDRGNNFIVTNKHVLENQRVSEIRAGEISYEFDEVTVSPSVDLGAVRVRANPQVPRFRVGDVRLLESVVTLGYPTVAGSVDNVLLAHRGEINGFVRIRGSEAGASEMLAISCHVAPGNSGGPVIDGSGRIVGVVSESAFRRQMTRGQDQGDVISTHHLAVPTPELVHFLVAELGLPLEDCIR
jgi:S1-C subfamily serine protease